MDDTSIGLMGTDFVLGAIGLAWLLILAVLAGTVAVEAWRAMRGEPALPLSGLLERKGLSLIQAEEAVGTAGLGAAARRCAACGSRQACARALRWGWLGFRAPPCPNAGFFTRL